MKLETIRQKYRTLNENTRILLLFSPALAVMTAIALPLAYHKHTLREEEQQKNIQTYEQFIEQYTPEQIQQMDELLQQYHTIRTYERLKRQAEKPYWR